jgi:hypothetical protein
VVTYLLHVFGPTISMAANPASGHLSSYGTLWEQNVFGAFAAAGAIAWVYLGPARFKRAGVGLALCAGGLFDSLTRAAWLAAALVGTLGVTLPGLRRHLVKRELAAGALGGLVLVVAALGAEALGHYNVHEPKAQSGGNLLLVILNLVDVIGRANQIGPMWNDISGHLAFGRGTASFEALYVVDGVPQHVASLPLLVLNDTGFVGLAVFCAFVVAVIARAWSSRSNSTVLGLGQAAIVIALTNLATETTELMIGWLLIGILVAGCDVATAAPAPSSSGARSPADKGQTNL